jgi:ribosomal protein S12 methylthiotransferase accessory factor
VVKTDQKERGGGEDSAPAPFDYFLVSLATCAGIYVKVFCDKRLLKDPPEIEVRAVSSWFL